MSATEPIISHIQSVPQFHSSAPREIADIVPMETVLEALGFSVNPRTRRCACLLHEGSNTSAFSWTEDGLWHCHSCGAGGDKIDLVREVRHCGFVAAVRFLAELAGIDGYEPRHLSPAERERIEENHKRAEAAAWDLYYILAQLRCHYLDRLNLADGWCAEIGQRLIGTDDAEATERLWSTLADLAPYQTIFLAALTYLDKAGTPERIAFALATDEQRKAILGGSFE